MDAGWKLVAGLVAVLALGLAVRLQPWSDVFGPERSGAAFVGDTDTYYHALRADRITRDYPRVPWHDPGMNYPLGADILWPPLFDHAIASTAFVVSAGSPRRSTVERVAAVLPPLLGVATVGAVVALGFVLLGRGPWLIAALLFAMLPSHVEVSVVGRPDQHVAELLLQALVMLTFAAAWVQGRRTAARWLLALALGVAIALSFWNWQGSALYLILLAGFAAVWHLYDGEGTVARRVHASLVRGAGIGAVLLLVSILLWGRPGAAFETSLSGVNGVQALLTALVAVFALGLSVALAARRGGSTPWKRGLEVLAAALVPMASAWILFPGSRSGVEQGLLALTAGNSWYASIREFQPPLFGGTGIRRELAAWIPRFAPMFVMPLAALGLVRLWRRRSDERPAVAFLAVWGVMLFIPTLLRMRFTLYLSIPAVLWTAIGLRELAGLVTDRLGRERIRLATVALGVSALLAPALFYFSHGGLRPNPTHEEIITALEWLRDRPVRDPERVAVFSEWDWGHLIQYHGARPAVATPFGTDGGAGAMEDMAAFFLTRSPEEASRILEQRRASHLLIVDPVTHAAESAAFAPPGVQSPVVIDWHPLRGPQLSATPEVDDLIAVRIYYDSGLSSRGLPSLANYRLVYEGSPAVPRQVRLFEIVPGAALLVRGATPGTVVRAAVGIRTHHARETTWHKTAEANGEGSAVLRVPFSTGENGKVVAGRYRVSCGGSDVHVTVPSGAVELGGEIEVTCRAADGPG